MSLLQNSNAISETGGYNIANSLRFQKASSQTLTRTFGSTYTDKTKSTFSVWLKRGLLNEGNGQAFLYYNSGGSGGSFGFAGANSGGTLVNDCLSIGNRNATSGVGDYNLQTTALYRDPSAWYHIIIVFDTSQATASNRLKLYINGEQVTAFVAATYPALNYQPTALLGGNAVAHQIGYNNNTGTPNYSDFYLAEMNFIDGQALTPSSFGETNALTGQWVAKKYTGTYGTNGFYLPFSNGTSTTTLGADSSGNGNNWTLNNFTRSAGTSDCWVNDVPSGNGSVVGGTQPNSNYAVLNNLYKSSTANATNANLTATSSTGNADTLWANITSPSGKFYCEVTVGATSANYPMVGIDPQNASSVGATYYPGYNSNGAGIGYGKDGSKFVAGAQTTSWGATYATGDVIGIAIDYSAGKVWFSKNGTWQASGDPTNGTNQAATFTIGTNMFPAVGLWSGASGHSFNFGQRSFAYTPPSGFKALCTANLPAATIKKGNTVFDATLWSGDNTASRNISNAASFKPDLVWVKCRSTANQSNNVVDSVRGLGANVMNTLYTNATDSETGVNTNASLGPYYGAVGAITSTGFTLTAGSGGATDQVNKSGSTYVAWQWNAGGSTVTNTSGTISSQVRANPTAGVSVVTYTGTGANATVGHGLGVAPKMVIVKSRTAAAEQWVTWHTGIAGTEYLTLNSTNAKATLASAWNSAIPTSSIFNIGTASGTNQSSANFVAYCFSEISGFSKFGSYTGNGSADGPFVYTGFRPKYVMIKRTDTAGYSWIVEDTSRDAYNVSSARLIPNTADAEATGTHLIDFLSNGFKLRGTSLETNGSSATYIYACFAESPFNYSNAR